jgi:dUTPase
MIRFELINKHAKLPTRSTVGAAGFDLFATTGLTVAPGQRATFGIGVRVAIPSGSDPLEIRRGDRVGQLVVVPYMGDSWQVDSLDDTDRGERGFGSTGR